MARLLIRSGKDPFTPVAAETTLTQDVFNSNSGNYLFQHAIWKSLALDGSELVSNSTLSERRTATAADAAAVNEQFDQFVVPMANAFRPEFAAQLDRLSDLIEQLTIPVTVVGIGSQAAHGAGIESLDAIAPTVQRFVSAVLERSASIGVRGEFTRAHLRALGFPDDAIDVIGCPSLTLWGPDFRVDKKVTRIEDDAPLALNLTPEVPGIGAFATAMAERHPDLVFIGQDARDLRLLLWGVPFPDIHDPSVPVHLQHPLLTSDRMRLFVDTWPWYEFLATRDFAFGTRFHGNVAALLAGTPALLLAHDSRTLELAEYHQMPFLSRASLDADVDVDALHAATDLSAFNAHVPEVVTRYATFLERNGLEHVWQPGAKHGEFDARLEAATFPPAVRPVTADATELVQRLQWLRDGTVLDLTRSAQRYEAPFGHPAYQGAGSRHARLQKKTDDKIAAQERQIAKLADRIDELETWHRRTISGWIWIGMRRLKRWMNRA